MGSGDLKSKLRAKLTRRLSSTPSLSSADGEPQQGDSRGQLLRDHGSKGLIPTSKSMVIVEMKGDSINESPELACAKEISEAGLKLHGRDPQHQHHQDIEKSTPTPHLDVTESPDYNSSPTATHDPKLLIGIDRDEHPHEEHEDGAGNGNLKRHSDNTGERPPAIFRRQSIFPHQQTTLIKTLLETEIPRPSRADNLDLFGGSGLSTISPNMVSRKIWVKRPNASATLVTINEDDLVDDVREMILKKYANSLGKNFDAPDVTIRICPREQRQERTLGPEEPMCRTLDAYFPGGQTVEEALIIDVPFKRTPKPSPRGGVPVYYHDDMRPGEAGSDYFPPMPARAPSPHAANSVPVSTINGSSHSGASHSIAVLTTGHVPNLPSPGGSRRHYVRPRAARQHASSPTILSGHVQSPSSVNGTHTKPKCSRSRADSSAPEKSMATPAPSLPTPPPQDIQPTATPPPRVSSLRSSNRIKKSKSSTDHPALPAGPLNGAVPPINVLIVEDNIINLKLLEAFMKRLKVRWQTAMNGKEAVTKWRAGGFHLVLMDIQLPVMNGLEATREIRRLEKLNSVGVFSSYVSSSAPKQSKAPEGDDKLPNTELFKSSVIIVALTASSLQSDRHEALAAGCNDFLTKVKFNPTEFSVLCSFFFFENAS